MSTAHPTRHAYVPPDKRRPWRLATALAILALAIAGSLISLWTPYLRVCAADAQGHVTCRPLQVTDPIYPLIGLLLVGIVWPDLKSFKIPGVVEVERKPEVITQGEDLRERDKASQVKFDEYLKEIESRGEQGRG